MIHVFVLVTKMIFLNFEIVGNLDYGHFDDMLIQFGKCNSDEFTFEDVYALYRGAFLATVYWSIAGMILATFYFLFKRMDEQEYAEWRWKARWLVISLFFSTAFAICSLILLTNTYFAYYLMSTDMIICGNDTLRYTLPGLMVAGTSFAWSLFLVW